jgi:hypothetical protein
MTPVRSREPRDPALAKLLYVSIVSAVVMGILQARIALGEYIPEGTRTAYREILICAACSAFTLLAYLGFSTTSRLARRLTMLVSLATLTIFVVIGSRLTGRMMLEFLSR